MRLPPFCYSFNQIQKQEKRLDNLVSLKPLFSSREKGVHGKDVIQKIWKAWKKAHDVVKETFRTSEALGGNII